jgi:hypothetical protein
LDPSIHTNLLFPSTSNPISSIVPVLKPSIRIKRKHRPQHIDQHKKIKKHSTTSSQEQIDCASVTFSNDHVNQLSGDVDSIAPSSDTCTGGLVQYSDSD